MYSVYGIPNCDTVKKTRVWLDDNKLPYLFHNYKTDGITAARLESWSKQVGWQTLLNTKSATWRGLDEKTRARITTAKTAIALMVENPSIIKRPVITKEDGVIAVGFNAAEYKDKFLR